MTTTVSKFRRHLAELNIWLPQLHDLETTTTNPHTTPNGHANTNNPERLPFGLDNRVDSLDKGPHGVRTEQGARTIIQQWANSIAPTLGHHTPITSPIYYLHKTASDAALLPTWDTMTSEISHLRDWAAQLTGHADTTIGTCPRDGGNITTTPTDSGIPEYGTCNTCDHWYADHKAIERERERVNRERITTITGENAYVTLETVLRNHPTLERKTLNQWVQRGHVNKNQHGYQIAPINLRMGTIP